MLDVTKPAKYNAYDAPHADIREFLAYVLASLAPGVESFGYLPVQQAELPRNVGSVKTLFDLVLPGQPLS